MGINNFLLRTAAILLHAIVSLLLVNWLLRFDITGSWMFFIGFVFILLFLIYLFVRHLIAYYYFFKTKTK